MSLKIRLARSGTKKRPYYRIVVADSRMPRDGRFIERLGSYNPMVPKDHPERTTLKEDRIKHWLGFGARPSDRVARMLANAGLVEKPVYRDQTKQDKPKAKTLERQREKAEKVAAAEEAAKEAEAAAATAAAEAAAAAAEAPAEEAPVEEAAAEAPVAEEVAEG